MRRKQTTFQRSCGNVFADLELPDADALSTKARLGMVIAEIVEAGKLTQKEVAKKLEIAQPKVSALLNHKLAGFSVERLMSFVTALGYDVEIYTHQPGRVEKPGRIDVLPKGRSFSASVAHSDPPPEPASSWLRFPPGKYAAAMGIALSSPCRSLPRLG